jgi:hypothetical protein
LLAQAMPRAARQVEDAFVTGCYSGGEVTMDQYRLILPQVKTIWAYEAQAPGVDNGGALDQAGWERRREPCRQCPVPKNIVAKHMAVWNSKRGYVAFKPPMGVNELRGKVEWMQKNFFAPLFRAKSHTRWTTSISDRDYRPADGSGAPVLLVAVPPDANARPAAARASHGISASTRRFV